MIHLSIFTHIYKGKGVTLIKWKAKLINKTKLLGLTLKLSPVESPTVRARHEAVRAAEGVATKFYQGKTWKRFLIVFRKHFRKLLIFRKRHFNFKLISEPKTGSGV